MAALISGCETSSTISQTSPTPADDKCQVTLSAPPMIDSGGGRGIVAVTTQPECAWTASSPVNWISGVTPGSGQGTREVEFQVAPNPDVSVREGEFVVNNSRVRVSQRAACRYVLTPATQTMAASGGDSTVIVGAGPDCAWTATTDASWITLNQPAGGTGNGTVSFSAVANSSTDRVGTITVAGQRATVSQSTLASTCTFSISPTSQNIGAAGGAGTAISVITQNACGWGAQTNDFWITLTSGSNGTGNGSVTFSVAANTGAARTGSLTVASRSFTVTQAAAGAATCSYSLSAPSQNVAAGGGSGSVTVSTAGTCAWTATSNAAWITVTSGATGSGNGPVGYTVAANTGAARAGTVTIAGQTFTVNQAAGTPCSYSISPTSQQVDDKAGSKDVNVTTSAGCAWTATSNASWITITSGAIGAGNGKVVFTIAANTGGDRTGTLTIAGQTATVQQKAK